MLTPHKGHSHPAAGRRLHEHVTARPPVSSADPAPRDWSHLGQWVLAEAVRRATDGLVHRGGLSAAPGCPCDSEPRS